MGKKTFKRKLNPNEEQAKLYDRITYVETKIIHKINKLKKQKNIFTLCHHQQKPSHEAQYDQNFNYYDKFWKQYMTAITLMKRIHEMENHVLSLESSVGQIQKKFIERQKILDLPALAVVKKSISRYSRVKSSSEEKSQINGLASNSVAQLKKQEQVEPHLINYESQQNHIFYE